MTTKPPNRLALDLGTRCGWALRGPNGEQWGVWELDATGKRGDAPRLDLFARLLTRTIDQFLPTELLVEEPFIANMDSLRTSRVLLGLLAFAQVIAWRRELPLRLVNPADIKKAAIGATSRKAEKGEKGARRGRIWFKGPDVLEAVNRRRAGKGLALVDDPNAGIAVALLDMADAEDRGTGAPSGALNPVADVRPKPRGKRPRAARPPVPKARGRRPILPLKPLF